MYTIDAHQHYWRLADRAGLWPGPELTTIHRDFLPHDLLPLLQRNRVDGTVLVQSLASHDDNDFLLDLAQPCASVLGVVGWVEMKAEDAPAQIGRLAARPKLRGLRPMLQDLDDDDWIADAATTPAAQAMSDHGLVFDALVRPRQLPGLERFARRHPGLAIVIDHAAKPPIAAGDIGPWREAIGRLAALPNVHCKLSGLLTEAAEGSGAAELEPWVEVVLASFGAERVLWGSDWPVLRLAADYDSWLATSGELLSRRSALDRAGIFGGNALRLYRLTPPLVPLAPVGTGR